MELIIESGLLKQQAVEPLHTEAGELAKDDGKVPHFSFSISQKK